MPSFVCSGMVFNIRPHRTYSTYNLMAMPTRNLSLIFLLLGVWVRNSSIERQMAPTMYVIHDIDLFDNTQTENS